MIPFRIKQIESIDLESIIPINVSFFVRFLIPWNVNLYVWQVCNPNAYQTSLMLFKTLIKTGESEPHSGLANQLKSVAKYLG